MLRKKVFLYVSFVKSVQFVCAIIHVSFMQEITGLTFSYNTVKYFTPILNFPISTVFMA